LFYMTFLLVLKTFFFNIMNINNIKKINHPSIDSAFILKKITH